MRLIRKVIVVALLFFVCIGSNSQIIMSYLPPTVILTESNVSLEEDETISLDSLISLTSLGFIDSTVIPCAELYKYIWDNRTVNPYKVRIADLPDTLRIDFSQYCHPNRNVVTSGFGYRRGRFHYGIDTRLKTGDSICSSFDGMVRIAQRGRAYGNYVVIRHFNGLETVYGHLSKILVNANQIVRAGEVFALGGSTGRSTGPHLHYEIRYLGHPIPPRDVIDFENYAGKYRIFELTAQQFAYAKELDEVRFYTVRKGDTLSGISRKTGVSIDRICQLNSIKRSSILRVGQRLRYT